MADPVVHGRELDAALEFAANEARRYVEGLSGDYVLRPGTEAAIERWADPMPEHGDGALEALAELSGRAREAATRSSGPRFFQGATMANFVALAAARNWWADRLGVDVDQDGLSNLPAPLIVSSGYLHPSAAQAIGMLGLGRASGDWPEMTSAESISRLWSASSPRAANRPSLLPTPAK